MPVDPCADTAAQKVSMFRSRSAKKSPFVASIPALDIHRRGVSNPQLRRMSMTTTPQGPGLNFTCLLLAFGASWTSWILIFVSQTLFCTSCETPSGPHPSLAKASPAVEQVAHKAADAWMPHEHVGDMRNYVLAEAAACGTARGVGEPCT